MDILALYNKVVNAIYRSLVWEKGIDDEAGI